MKNKNLLRLLIALFVLVLMPACGKKGPPTLKMYEPPASPSNLEAVHRGDMITLSWSYPARAKKNIKGFQILRSEDGDFKDIAFVAGDRNSFSDENFKAGTSYRYKIVALNLKDIAGAGSNVITVTPKRLPPAPKDVRARVGTDSVEISWKGAKGEACYNIYKTSEKGKYADKPLNRKPVCATSFTDDVLPPDSPVFYTIRATPKGTKDEGHPSDEIEVKRKANR